MLGASDSGNGAVPSTPSTLTGGETATNRKTGKSKSITPALRKHQKKVADSETSDSDDVTVTPSSRKARQRRKAMNVDDSDTGDSDGGVVATSAQRTTSHPQVISLAETDSSDNDVTISSKEMPRSGQLTNKANSSNDGDAVAPSTRDTPKHQNIIISADTESSDSDDVAVTPSVRQSRHARKVVTVPETDSSDNEAAVQNSSSNQNITIVEETESSDNDDVDVTPSNRKPVASVHLSGPIGNQSENTPTSAPSLSSHQTISADAEGETSDSDAAVTPCIAKKKRVILAETDTSSADDATDTSSADDED